MDVSAESHVVGKIPAHVIGIVVDYDLVVVPIPIITVGQVKGSHAEVEAVEPKAIWPASGEVPHVVRAEAAGEAAMLPRMIEMEAGLVGAVVVPHPFAVVMDVRRLGVTGFVGAGGSGWCGMAMRRRRPMFGNVSATDSVIAGLMVIVLRERRKRKQHRYGKH